MARRDLYPAIEAFHSDWLDVGEGHRLYYEQSGNPKGHPVVFLHGGPGAGTSPEHRRFFNPAHYHIIIFDQRGAGKSTPLGGLNSNTTQDLVGDIEKLRKAVGVERWQIFGGSWGSTLALVYAQTCPERVSELILRGIFLGRMAELDWFMHDMGRFFPEAAEKFVNFLPPEEQDDLTASYYARLINPDPTVHMPAARHWSNYEGACSTLLPTPESQAGGSHDNTALSLARTEAHYFINSIFLEENQILDNMDCIQEIPATIVQGRYDVICPPHTAMDLHRAWPGSELIIVPDGGHSAMDPGIRSALLDATDSYVTSPARQTG